MTTQGVEPRQDFIRIPPEAPGPYVPIVLRLDPVVQLTDLQLEALSSVNEILRIERNAQGDLELQYLRPTMTGHRNAKISTQLYLWARKDGAGVAFGSNAGFTLPNGAIRAPDASWVLKSRLAELNEEQRQGFWHICPDFVIEIRSISDALDGLRRKMEEYIASGSRLGWLIDSIDGRQRVYVYRPGVEVEVLERPESLSGDPELPGFTLDLKPIWEPDF